MSEKAVIIGAGQAGAQAAVSLRQAKFDGDIVIIGEEDALPYQRPPLSKAYLKGELDVERLYLRPRNFYDAQNIQLCLDDRTAQIDRDRKVVTTASGREYSYTKLLLATGAPPRRLDCAGGALGGVYYLRTLRDADTLRSILTAEGKVVIIGAGYIGLEVAAVARQAGRDVTVVELADRVLARVASAPVSDFYQRLHKDAGVEFLFGERAEAFLGASEVESVELASAKSLSCAAALIGIGALPDVEIAKSAGLEIDNGIVVDDHARTSDPSIWAAGDCTNFPSPRYGRRMRLESVPNAIEQAKAAAANMAGGDVVYDALPWFWSDQYDVKLQTVGLSEGHDNLVVRGQPGEKKMSVWYLKEGAVLAVDAINDPAAFAIGKKVILDGKQVTASALGDVNADLKALIS